MTNIEQFISQNTALTHYELSKEVEKKFKRKFTPQGVRYYRNKLKKYEVQNH